MSLRRETFTWVAALVVSLMLGCSSSAGKSPEELVDKAREKLTSTSGNAGLEEALKLTERALEEDKAYVPAHNARINSLLEMGRLESLEHTPRTFVPPFAAKGDRTRALPTGYESER